MTRDEAIRKVAAATGESDYGRLPANRDAINRRLTSLEALGLIKFDEPKSVAQEAVEALTFCGIPGEQGAAIGPKFAAVIVSRLDAMGFRIVKDTQ